jgi:hypothetical protein
MATLNENMANDVELLSNDDFVLAQRDMGNGEKEFVGGGFKIESFFLDNNVSPMTTFNIPSTNTNSNTKSNTITGGKVSSPFENLAVPAGLFYINQKVPKNKDANKEEHYKQHTMAPDDLMDKLFGLVEMDKKRKRKTRKQSITLTKNKRTRRNT